MMSTLAWAHGVGWNNLNREDVFDHAESHGATHEQLVQLSAHMDLIMSRLCDECAAAMAGVMLIDSGFDWDKEATDADWDDWS